MFFLTVICIAACSPADNYESRIPYRTYDACIQSAEVALWTIGRKPEDFRVECVRRFNA